MAAGRSRGGGAAKDSTALFVRIPQAQARALDRLAFTSGRPKQALVSEMLAGHLSGERRVTVELPDTATVVGRHAFHPYEPELAPKSMSAGADVLTLEEVAELLSVELEAVARLARSGELPGRRIGEHWRFSRRAVLVWLAAGSPPESDEV
jgi:excisionase family DNA binding protein